MGVKALPCRVRTLTLPLVDGAARRCCMLFPPSSPGAACVGPAPCGWRGAALLRRMPSRMILLQLLLLLPPLLPLLLV